MLVSASAGGKVPDDELLRRLAEQVAKGFTVRGLTLAAAESCTGGWVAKCLTDIAGSSGWFYGSIVAYSNALKQALLGVPDDVLERHGAVSEPVARAMAEGVLAATGADVACAVTGIAGPGGGTADKPVGTVWFAWARRDGATRALRECFPGDREAVRRASVMRTLRGLLEGVVAAELTGRTQ